MTNVILAPDAIKAMAFLGNASDTYRQPWQLPCDNNQLNCKQFNAEISSQAGREVKYEVLGLFKLKLVFLILKLLRIKKELQKS